MIPISILFSQTDDHALVRLGLLLEALRNGASGYVLKDSNSNYLIQAIKAVMSEQLRLTAQI
jgi:DNA-binding NarL/FixJ family response regulator